MIENIYFDTYFKSFRGPLEKKRGNFTSGHLGAEHDKSAIKRR